MNKPRYKDTSGGKESRESKVYIRAGENLPYKNQYVYKTRFPTGSRFESSTLHFVPGVPNENKSTFTFTVLPTKDLLAFHEAYTFCIKVNNTCVCVFFIHSGFLCV